jgi:AraC-like DNA-binding protein
LRDVNLSVTEICLLVGFESVGSFGTLFRRLVGSSPTEYRDRQRAAAGAQPPIPGCALMMWTRPSEARIASAEKRSATPGR